MIKVILNNGFYYKGEILNENENFLIIKDIRGKEVTIIKNSISIREVTDEWKNQYQSRL